ncbi:MAG: YraN family protein [Myxococcota bacterium]
MTHARRQTGLIGEERAALALRRAGYRVLSRNYRCRYGEIDLVAEEGDAIVFVEVKARRTSAYGDPALAITARKRRRIARAAQHYLSVMRMPDRRARFDVVTLVREEGDWRIRILRNAFEVES